MMQREKITQLMSAYEESHPVDSYMAYDWHAWPVIRMYFSLKLHEDRLKNVSSQTLLEKNDRKLYGILKYAKQAISCFISFIKLSYLRKYKIFEDKHYDIAILTHTNRTEWIEEAFYHYLSEPLVELINSQKKSTIVLELGKPYSPCHALHNFCGQRFDLEYKIEKFLNRNSSILLPDWFHELKEWSFSVLSYDLSWAEIKQRFWIIQVYRNIFKRWFENFRCSKLILDYWYGPKGMGAMLAAKDHGIKRIDLQHGLQGHGHFAYSSWKKCPQSGYDLIPDHFMVWGNDDAESILNSNNRILVQNRISILGNLWLNKWRDKSDSETFQSSIATAHAVTANYKKVIIVTLQKGIGYIDDLIPAISSSSNDWLWFIRLHRHMKDQIENIKEEFAAVSHSHINIHEATQLPLYALFNTCNCHITWFSTCAIEAAAFGIPTILLHPSGVQAFSKYIKKGIMISAIGQKKINRAIRNSFDIHSDQCKKAAESAFADTDASLKAIENIIG